MKGLTAADLKAYKSAMTSSKFDSFEECVFMQFGIWCSVLNEEDYLKSTCTCPPNFFHYVCKHIIGIASIAKIVKIPANAKTVEIGQKPKRGRPIAAKRALEYKPIAPAPVAPAQPIKSSVKRKATDDI